MKSSRILREVVKCSCGTRPLTTFTGKTSRPLSTAPSTKPKVVEDAQKTSLYDLHLKYNGKMVKFAGYYLPIQYNDASISSSHLHTRSNCSIFDVSHMLQSYITGKDAVQFLESLCVADIAGMKNNQSTLSLYTNETAGGIIDDLIITKISNDKLYIVSNASRQNVDKELLLDRLDSFRANNKDVNIEFLHCEDQSLIAIQGPKTSQILQPFVNVNLEELYFMNSASANVCGIENCRITRCGYTGEDGVEVSIPSENVSQVVESLLNNEFVKLAGLGARDTLRLEAGLCLHGNDIDETTTPVEAALTWTIGKRRRQEADFPGAQIILNQIKNGVSRKRVGLIKVGGAPARSGSKIIGFNDEVIGEVTSGCPSPSLGVNVAMGYVENSYAKVKTDVRVKIRDNTHNATISKMPFAEAKYYNKPKPAK